jgi:hypothetical protein
MPFDVAAAQKAGYTEDEILPHLTETRKFDVAGALKSGYSKQDVIAHLAGTPETAVSPYSTIASVAGNVIGNAVQMADASKNFLKGAGSELAHTAIQVNDWTSPVELLKRVTGEQRLIQRPEVQAVINPKLGPGGGTGRAAAMMAEAVVPGGVAMKLARGTPLVARMGAQALAEGATAAVQTEGNPLYTGIAAAGGAAGPAIGAAWQAIRGVPKNPIEAITQAIKPKSTNIQWSQNLNRSMPELKATEQQLGRPIATIDDLVGVPGDPAQPGAIRLAKQKVRAEYDAIAGPSRDMGTMVDLTPVADSMARSITKKMLIEEPEKAAAIMERAAQYRGKFKLEDAEDLLKTTNAELDSYFSKYPTAQRGAIAGNPETALLDSQAKSLREQIYKTLDAPGQGAAARELQRRYGSLLDMEEEAYRRYNVAKRQAPESLSEQLGKWHATGRVVRGGLRALGGDVAGGAADVGSAIAERKAAMWLKERNTTDALIKQAFAGWSRAPVPIVGPPPVRISGQLPPATTRFAGPVPDPSSVTSVPADVVPGTAASRTGRLLTAGDTITPPPADTSGVVIVDAARGIARDPKTGKMFRYYGGGTKLEPSNTYAVGKAKFEADRVARQKAR